MTGCSSVLCQTARADDAAASAAFLASYRWKSRLLLIFAPRADDADFGRQRTALAEAGSAGWRERDLLVIEIVGDALRGDAANARAGLGAALRRHYAVREDSFRAVLIGKDGGTKLAATNPISPERLATVIDAMPMRRREMRGG